MKKKILYSCDTGVDDALALAYLAAQRLSGGGSHLFLWHELCGGCVPKYQNSFEIIW